jgi:hypothetical protein
MGIGLLRGVAFMGGGGQGSRQLGSRELFFTPTGLWLFCLSDSCWRSRYSLAKSGWRLTSRLAVDIDWIC